MDREGTFLFSSNFYAFIESVRGMEKVKLTYAATHEAAEEGTQGKHRDCKCWG